MSLEDLIVCLRIEQDNWSSEEKKKQKKIALRPNPMYLKVLVERETRKRENFMVKLGKKIKNQREMLYLQQASLSCKLM